MAAYSGSSYPYWMTITGNGTTADPGAESENVPVTAGTSYSFSADVSFSGFFTGGVTLTLTWYESGGTQISTVTSSSGGLSPAEIVTVSTASTAAPANATYAIAKVAANGTPGASNVLSVYSAALTPQSSMPVNINYAFVWSFWPWTGTAGAVLGWQADQFLLDNSDSMVLGGVIELMGGAGGVPCQAVPELLDSNGIGPRYRILAPPSLNMMAYGYEASYDMNAPQPTQDVVASMLLDGERPFGTRASNRTISLPIMIFGTLDGGMRQVLHAREYLMALIDQQIWQIIWTPADTGKPMIYDCFRALPSVPLYGFNYSAGGSATSSAVGRPNYPIAMITLSIQALPYGRSDVDGIVSLPFANSLINSPTPAGSLTVDDFSAVTTGEGWTEDTAKFVEGGTASIRYDAPLPLASPYPAATYSRTLTSAVNLTGLTALSVWAGQAYDSQWAPSPSFISNLTLAWTLTDSLNRTISFSTTEKAAAWGALPSTPKWTRITAPIPQGYSDFSYGDVTKYSVTATNWAGSGNTGLARMHLWLNDLVAVPQTVANAASPRGMLYNLFSLQGSARAPINVQCQLPSTGPVSQEITTPASGYWIVPPGVYSIEGEAWAGGGAGATVNLARGVQGAGGGGGEYAAEKTLDVLPGTKIPFSLGAGGTPSQVEDTIIDFTAPGLSHWACPDNVTSVLIECWGAGAAGAAGSGGGGAGGYSSSTLTVTPGTTYYITVGAGGQANSGTTAADNAARNGGPSWFGTDTTTGTSNALVAASGGISPITGSTTGGSGGTNSGCPGTTQYSGGNGGHAPGGGGGGGGGCAGRSGHGHHGHAPWANSGSAAWCGSGAGGDGDNSYGSTGSGYQHGGNGGAGSSCPGTPSGGGYPGGGGGGGFCGTYFQYASQPVQATPGQVQVNYMGANGGNGLVQLTYAVGNGNAVDGGDTTFGSTSTTGTVVTAHGGKSAALNAATGATGGTGSTNTVHFDGGAGGLDTGTSMGSWMFGLDTGPLFQTLSSFSYSGATHTSGAAASSCSHGAGVVVVVSTSPVYDLVVTDSAGNTYINEAQQGGGTATTNGCVYTFVAPLAYPVTTATTLTLSSATSQEYGAIWYASPWVTGTTGANETQASGTGTALAGAFGTTDNVTAQYEFVVAFNDSGASFGTPTYDGRLWYAAGSTSSLTAGTSLTAKAYTGFNMGGGTGSASGDAFDLTLGASADWAVICLPLMAVSQQAYVPQLDWRSGTTPGASTSWTLSGSVQAEGVMLVVGAAGSGVTAGPTSVTDHGGNAYTVTTMDIPSNGGVLFAATAPVTAAMAQGATGSVTWGSASAAPEYWTATYWIPNASAASAPVTATGATTAVTASYTPADTGELLLALVGNAVSGFYSGGVAAPWNYLGGVTQSYLAGRLFGAQATDLDTLTASFDFSAQPWALMQIPVKMAVKGSGGGAAGGAGNAGYPSTFYAGGPGYAGGGKGGLGAQSVNTNGGGASLPGGGGGGSYGNTTNSIEGGQGGSGAVRVTYNPPLTPFNTLIVHRPGLNASRSLSPLVPIPISDVPNNTEYTIVNASQPSVNAVFNSTYTVMLVANSWDSTALGSARTITVTVSQYEYQGGPASQVQVSRSVTPATDIVNGMVNMGEVTLPIKDYAKFNDQSYFTVSIADTDQNDRFMDVLFLDTTGQTVLVNIDPSQPGYNTYVNYYIDEPTADRDLGFIGGTCQDRQHNVSLMEYTFISGGPLYIAAGDNLLLTYSPSGAPSLGVSFSPRWYLDRIV